MINLQWALGITTTPPLEARRETEVVESTKKTKIPSTLSDVVHYPPPKNSKEVDWQERQKRLAELVSNLLRSQSKL